MVTKPCIGCGRSLPIDAYYAHLEMADGRLNRCKECVKAAVRANAKAKPDYYRERYRLYATTPQGKAARAKAVQKMRAAHPEKFRARSAVATALKYGRLLKRPCQSCGSVKSQAHHGDYSRPLDVEWLCFRCHRAEHGQEVAP